MEKEMNTEVEREAVGCEDHVHETKERSEKEYKDMINRLSRIEGQIRHQGNGGKECVLYGYSGTGCGSECGAQ